MDMVARVSPGYLYQTSGIGVLWWYGARHCTGSATRGGQPTTPAFTPGDRQTNRGKEICTIEEKWIESNSTDPN